MDEIQRIVIQVENEAKLRQYNEMLANQKKTLEELIALRRQQGGTLTPGQEATYGRTTAGAVQSVQGIQQASSALRGASGNPQAMMQFGYAIEDFMAVQGGMAQRMGAIANNLQMVAASMGVGGGMFVGITAAIVGIKALVQNFDTINALLRGLPDPKELARRAAETKKTGEEADRLRGTPTPAEAARAGMATSAMTAAGFRGVGGGIEAALFAGAPAEQLTKEERAAVEAEFYVRGSVHDTAGLEKAMQMRMAVKTHKVIRDAANWLLAEAGKPGAQGTAALNRLADLATKNPKLFPQEFIDNINQARRGTTGPISPADMAGPPREAMWEPGGQVEGRVPVSPESLEQGRFVGPPDLGPQPSFWARRGIPGAGSATQDERDAEAMRAAARRSNRQRLRQQGPPLAEARPANQVGPSELDAEAARIEQNLGMMQERPDIFGPGDYSSLQLRLMRIRQTQEQMLNTNSRMNGGQMQMGNFSAQPPLPFMGP